MWFVIASERAISASLDEMSFAECAGVNFVFFTETAGIWCAQLVPTHDSYGLYSKYTCMHVEIRLYK